MMPVALVMSLYRHHTGEKAVDVSSAPGDLDVTASRSGEKIYLHVINTNRDRSVSASLRIDGMKIVSGRIFELAAGPEFEVIQTQSDEISPRQKNLPASCRWIFPPASVSAVELDAQKV